MADAPEHLEVWHLSVTLHFGSPSGLGWEESIPIDQLEKDQKHFKEVLRELVGADTWTIERWESRKVGDHIRITGPDEEAG